MKNKYLHEEKFHNLTSPQIIVPEIVKLLHPKSVIDIGCGIGTFLYCFKEQGVSEVLGVDGPWVNRALLSKYLSEDEFIETDLEKPLSINKKYDLVMSLEVAEHISETSADIFVKNLVSLGKFILFSAAIPLQGGQNHINEQWLTYWEEKFLRYDYIIYDVIRPLFWDNPDVFTWYKQNMVLIVPKDLKIDFGLPENPLRNVVHYNLFVDRNNMLNQVIEEKNKRIKEIVDGKLSVLTYVKYILKSLTGISNIKRFIHKNAG